MTTYSLSDFTAFIRRVLALNLPEAVWVTAELGQTGVSKGHTYLTLIEKDTQGDEIVAQVEAVLWAGQRQKIIREHGLSVDKIFQAGLEVRLRVHPEFHDRFGFKLIVEDADPVHTLGKLALKRQATLSALRRAGLLELNRQLPLAIVPQKLAVISSETAAGYADFRQELLRNADHYYYETVLFPAAMQGESAPGEIRKALKKILRKPTDFDAVVIIRGGGSRMDLIAFDDEELCRSIARSALPVLVGIGHETDEVLLDHVAHLALKTPTAVAAFLLDRSRQLEGKVLHIAALINRAGQRRLAQANRQLDHQVGSLRRTKASILEREKARLTSFAKDLRPGYLKQLERSHELLDHTTSLLDAYRPETVLRRGFALLSQEGRIVRSVGEIQSGKTVNARLQDGEVDLEIK